MDSEDEDLEEELRAEAALLRAATSDSAVPHTTNTTQFAHERASGRQREADEDHGEEQRQQQSKGTAVLSSAAQRDPSTGRDMTATGSSAHMTHTDMSRAANRLENENNSEDEDDMDLDVAEDVALLQAAAYPHGGTFPTAHTHTMQTDADADEDEDDMELAQDIALLQAAAAPLQAAGAHSLGPHPAAVPATPVVTAAAAVSGAELLTSALQACGWPADAGLPCQAAALNRCYQVGSSRECHGYQGKERRQERGIMRMCKQLRTPAVLSAHRTPNDTTFTPTTPGCNQGAACGRPHAPRATPARA